MAQQVKNLPANAEDVGDSGLIPGWGRPLPPPQPPHRGGHGKPFQYSRLENPMDRGAWEGHRATKSCSSKS